MTNTLYRFTECAVAATLLSGTILKWCHCLTDYFSTITLCLNMTFLIGISYYNLRNRQWPLWARYHCLALDHSPLFARMLFILIALVGMFFSMIRINAHQIANLPLFWSCVNFVVWTCTAIAATASLEEILRCERRQLLDPLYKQTQCKLLCQEKIKNRAVQFDAEGGFSIIP